jgi:S-ribosylhomocysteine lyase
MYVLFSGEPDESSVMHILQDMYSWMVNFSWAVPGATAAECGNYQDHNLSAAQEDAKKFLEIIKNNNELGKYKYL